MGVFCKVVRLDLTKKKSAAVLLLVFSPSKSRKRNMCRPTQETTRPIFHSSKTWKNRKIGRFGTGLVWLLGRSDPGSSVSDLAFSLPSEPRNAWRLQLGAHAGKKKTKTTPLGLNPRAHGRKMGTSSSSSSSSSSFSSSSSSSSNGDQSAPHALRKRVPLGLRELQA